MKTQLLAALLLATASSFAQQKELKTYRDTTATNFFRFETGMTSGDGGMSIALADGRSLWLMGDSHINDFDPVTKTIPCLFQVNNSAVLQGAKSWKQADAHTLTGNGPGRKSLFKASVDDKEFYWPVSGIQLKDTVYVFCAGIELTKAGGMGFAGTGNFAFAKMKFPEMVVDGYIPLKGSKIPYGIGFVKEGKYVYAYGHNLNKVGMSEIYVGRFLADKPYTAWQYWDGKAWQADATKAAVIGTTDGGTPMVAKVKNRYVLVGSQLSVGCDQGTEIYMASSASPTGPFSAKKKIHTIDNRVNGHSPFFYLPALHPEFINDKNEILLTYSINGYGNCVEWCINGRANPDHYRLQGVRVPLKLIDTAIR
ncbi:DUF4185 domain-containing protein [Mucilaginibacter limnophilus]|uniref:DUF4185 domain-containing protein n=1 Tax=Mucilaginibacter limnophilus TaxID=1932778 RepID=A0A3S2WW73_9SPHI|nr:DUF4185 domain-containing protein [Mucilaginibacter limnophilus]RVT98129.1 DUF4185 domain-containing protein [Mucilaginibacter limnophilus]